ncbi:MAG TPA: TonB family protein [Terracidiphilus sp.]|nr:TonB family protein [Terracidiphilus sp.]
MLRSISIVLFVMLATETLRAQQTSTPQPSPQAPSPQAPPQQPPTPRERVEVHVARSGVKAPLLLPLNPPFAWTKKCGNEWDNVVKLSLLVDTAGMPRNIMFLRPSGSAFDGIALEVAGNDRFQPGTLDGKPVVVAISLQLKLETCVATFKDAAGKIKTERLFRSQPRQKVVKPVNPPQEAVLAPLKTPENEIVRKVSRPDYFGNGVSAPVLIYSVDAQYTPSKRGAKISGICKISLVVNANGMPENVRVLKSLDPGLDRNALNAVNDYRFFPAIEDEEPVPAAVVVDVKFTPPDVLYSPDLE